MTRELRETMKANRSVPRWAASVSTAMLFEMYPPVGGGGRGLVCGGGEGRVSDFAKWQLQIC